MPSTIIIVLIIIELYNKFIIENTKLMLIVNLIKS